MKSSVVDQACLEKLKPKGITTAWYSASIDVVGKHLSGLLLIKEMPDSVKRVVFTNEAGVTFFDFEFSKQGVFSKKYAIRQLDKKVVIEVLKDDFSLLLAYPFKSASWQQWTQGNEVFYGTNQKNELSYFITDQDCGSLRRLESGSRKKKKVSIVLSGPDLQTPDSIAIEHHTFSMTINLKKIYR